MLMRVETDKEISLLGQQVTAFKAMIMRIMMDGQTVDLQLQFLQSLIMENNHIIPNQGPVS